jgi:hypothetical protein
MKQPNGKLKPEQLSASVIDFLGTADACRVFLVDNTTLSKMRSMDVDGHDNHRKSPFERVGDIVKAIRIEIEDGRGEGREILSAIGQYFAGMCRGKFLSEEQARNLAEIMKGIEIIAVFIALSLWGAL